MDNRSTCQSLPASEYAGECGLLLFAMLLLACNAYDPTLLSGAGPARWTTTTDAGGCDPRVERCNGEDDDCDGRVDEDEGQTCQIPRATSRCLGGACVLDTCDLGYLNCNGSASDGCETAADARACGECGRVCALEPTGADAGRRVTEGPSELDAGPRMDDAGSPACEPERCDNRDNDCDGRTDEDPICNCQAARPTARSTACDSCACARCASPVAECYTNANAPWISACSSVMRCYGVNLAQGLCDASGDCYRLGVGVCAGDVARTSIWSGRNSCIGQATPALTPCDAAASLLLCLRDQCGTVCNPASLASSHSSH